MNQRTATFISGPGGAPPITLAVERRDGRWRVRGDHGDFMSKAAIVVLDDGEVIENKHGLTTAQRWSAVARAVDFLRLDVLRECEFIRASEAEETFAGEAVADRLLAAVDGLAWMAAGSKGIDAHEAGDRARGESKAAPTGIAVTAATGDADVDGGSFLRHLLSVARDPSASPESRANAHMVLANTFVRSTPFEAEDVARAADRLRSKRADGLPDREGHWWAKVDGDWEVVQIMDVTGDGLRVLSRVGRPTVEDMVCDAWGHRVPDPDEIAARIPLHEDGFNPRTRDEVARGAARAFEEEISGPFPPGSFEAEHVKAAVERDRQNAEMLGEVLRDLDNKRLRELAEAATPGPWDFCDGWLAAISGDDVETTIAHVPDHVAEADRQYLAAVDPTTVLALLDAAERQAPKVGNMVAGSACTDAAVQHITEAMITDWIALARRHGDDRSAGEIRETAIIDIYERQLAGARTGVVTIEEWHKVCAAVGVPPDVTVGDIVWTIESYMERNTMTRDEWSRLCAAAGLDDSTSVYTLIDWVDGLVYPSSPQAMASDAMAVARQADESPKVRAAAFAAVAALAGAMATQAVTEDEDDGSSVALEGPMYGPAARNWQSTMAAQWMAHVEAEARKRGEQAAEDTLRRLRSEGVPVEEALKQARQAGEKAEVQARWQALGPNMTEAEHARWVEWQAGEGVGAPGPADGVAFLEATPAGSCRRYSERRGQDEVTFEDDRRPSGAHADPGVAERAAAMAKLEQAVAKMLNGSYGAGKFVIGEDEVYIADPRLSTMLNGKLSVPVSTKPRGDG